MRAKTHLIYGESGCYKTTQVGLFAEYIWRKYHKRTRLISCDPGGWATIEPHIQSGLIEAYSITNLEEPLTTIRRFSRGQWPKASGGKAVMADTDWEKSDVGAYAIESLTSISDLYMNSISKKTTGGEATPVNFTIEGERFAGNNRSHYNFVQNEIYSIVRSFGALPVHHVLFTALEAKGVDEGSQEGIRGPSIAGKAKIDKVPSWVGDCLHFESYTEPHTIEVKDETGKPFKSTHMKTVVRAYFMRHPDPKFPNVTYPAKPRIPARVWDKLFERWPGGYFIPGLTSGLDMFLEFEDELEQKAMGEIVAQM